MRVLVFPHSLSLGGGQLNAVELAEAVRELGHEVAVYGSPGPWSARLDEAGIEFVEAPEPRRRPDHRVVSDLRRRILRERIDIVHGYEWPPILEARVSPVSGLRPSQSAP